MIDSRFCLIKSAELYQRTGRKAQEIGILRVLVQLLGADSFRGFGVAVLQERLCLLKALFQPIGNRSSPELVTRVR